MVKLPRSLQILLVVFFAVGLLYAAVTPPFEASDEVFHYPFVRYVAQGHGLPVQQLGVKQPWEQVAFHPPAYQFITAALTFWIDTSDFDSLRAPNPFARIGIPGTPQNVNYTRAAGRAVVEPFAFHGSALAIYICRLFSLLLSLGTIVMTYRLAETLFPASTTQSATYIPILAATLVAFNPEFIFISASVNNDSLTWLIAAASLLIAAKLVIGPQTQGQPEIGSRLWHAAAIGVLLGIAALSKVSALALIPIVGLGLLAQAVRTRQWRRFFVHGTLIVVIVGIMSGWWYVRNLILYNELLALDIHAKWTATRLEPYTLATFFAEWPSFWYSFWAMFGSFNIFASMWVYGFYTLLVLIGFVGAIWGLIRNRSKLASVNKWRWAAHGLIAFFILVTAISLLRWNLLSYSAQGRLMFTTLAPLFTYLAAGLLVLVPLRFSRAGTITFSCVLASIAAITALSIRPHYTPPTPIIESQLPPDLRLIQARLAPGVELIGYTLDTQRHIPGQSLQVTLYWRALEPISEDYNLFLHVLGRHQELVGSVDSWPGGGLRPTSFWKPGDIYPDTYEIALRNAVTPTTLTLDIAMWVDDPSRPFPITNLIGDPIPTLIVDAGVLDDPDTLVVQPTHPTTDTFEYGIQLLGYDLPETVTAADPVALTLYWQATEPVPANYTVFVHVVDESGATVAQADSPPAENYWPTSYWLPNRPLIDLRHVTFPASGNYRILVGLYDPETLVPLIAFRNDGSEWPDRAVELTTVTVK